jgi:hypothetical protein
MYEDSRILVHVAVAPLPVPDGIYACPGNDAVAVTVQLDEAVGERDLVDAECIGGAAETTAFCVDDGVRWSPGD